MGTESQGLYDIINKEHLKEVKLLEKTLQYDPEYKKIQPLIDAHPEKKLHFLQTIVLKYIKEPRLENPDYLGNSEYPNMTSKNHSIDGSRGWSEVRTNNQKLTGFSSSVRNSRYKAVEVEDKRDYFNNLKIIKKLQLEKKKREKIMNYVENKQLHKAQIEASKKIEEEERKKIEHEEQVKEWREKYAFQFELLLHYFTSYILISITQNVSNFTIQT